MTNPKNEGRQSETTGRTNEEVKKAKKDLLTSGVDETHDQVMDGYYSGTVDQLSKKSDEH